MSFIEFQSCMARMYLDRSFRELARLQPDKTLGFYKLSQEEKIAIQHIDQTSLDRFATSLRYKALDKLKRAFSATFSIFAEEAQFYADRYYDISPQRTYESLTDNAVNFGMFLEENFAVSGEVPLYASEIVRYEVILCEMRYLSATNAHQNSINPRDQEYVKITQPSNMFVRLNKRCRLENFKFDVPNLIKEARVEQHSPKNTNLIFVLSQGKSDPIVMNSNDLTTELISQFKKEEKLSDVIQIMVEKVKQTTGIVNEMQIHINITSMVERLIQYEVLLARVIPMMSERSSKILS